MVAGVDEDYFEVPGSSSGSGGFDQAGAAGLGTGASSTLLGGSGGAAGDSGGTGGQGASASGGGTNSGGTNSGGNAGVGGTATSCGSDGAECVPAVPADWSGPVLLAMGASQLPSCPTAFPTVDPTARYANLNAPAATCGCSCGTPKNPTCTAALLKEYSGPSNACLAETGSHTVGLNCGPVSFSLSSTSLRASGVLSSGGCTPTPTKSVPTANWGLQARVCTGANIKTDCSTGEVCAPPATAGFDLCIQRSGDQTCPTSYPTKQVVFAGFDETRGCSACTCGSAAGTCTGTVHLSQQDTCTPSLGSVSLYQCVSVTAGVNFARYAPNAALNVACPPSTVSPTGAATPKTPTTFCCR